MIEARQYSCVNCGNAVNALYKSYGPSVLKLTKCDKCKGIVDKYVEYDPVIVMIDLILMSKEAQRHVIYNTEFKSLWKLLIVLMMLETYGMWRNDSLFNIVVNSLCGIQSNSTINVTEYYTKLNLAEYLHINLSECQKETCEGWMPEQRDEHELFIWEKDFYVLFMSTFSGTVVFILIFHLLLSLFSTWILGKTDKNHRQVLKAFSLAYVSTLFTLPMLVWGNTDTHIETRTVHYTLVFGYSFVVYMNVCTVLYECPILVTIFALALGNSLKYKTLFLLTPYFRGLIS